MEVTAGIYNLCFYSVKDTLGNELWYGVTRFRMKKEGDKLTISLTVVMTDKTEVEVETSV